MNYFNQEIKCTVSNFKYLNAGKQRCILGSILIGQDNFKTTCESFEEK